MIEGLCKLCIQKIRCRSLKSNEPHKNVGFFSDFVARVYHGVEQNNCCRSGQFGLPPNL